MLRHYIVLALRNARRAPIAAAVNVLALALGLVCFVVVYAFVSFWEGAERHFANADRVGVVTTSFELVDGGFSFENDVLTPAHLGRYLQTDFPQIERVARATLIGEKTPVAAGERSGRFNVVAVDPEFLELFDLPFVAGDPRTALAAPRSVVLAKATAERLFGAADPVGRHVLVENNIDVTVTGVIDAVPEPSHLGRSKTATLHLDVLTTRNVLEAVRAQSEPANPNAPQENWFQADTITYVLLPRAGGLSFESLRDQLDEFAPRHVPKELLEFARLDYGLTPVTDVLRQSVDGELFLTDIGMSVSTALLLLGALVLGVACMNYANLSTARAATRLREVGVRKALGAQPSHLLGQHLAEAALAAVAATLLALAVFALLTPWLSSLVGTDLRAVLLGSWQFPVFVVLLVIGVTLVAGVYPALAISRVEPAKAVRASRATLGPRRLAAVLVGLQFAVASFLLITVAITSLQNAAMRRTGLATTVDPLVTIDHTNPAADIDRATLRTELMRSPSILSVAEAGGVPWTYLSATSLRESPEDTAVSHTVMGHAVGFDYFSTLDFELVAGRVFGREHGDEPSPLNEPPPDEERIVVDRSFATSFGFDSPAAAVGELVYSPGSESARPMRIVGVVEDKVMIVFDFDIRGGSFYTVRSGLPFTLVKVSRDAVSSGVEHIDAVWRTLAPNVAIERQFLDETFDSAYESYLRVSQVFSALAAIAFAISITGLFGTATLVASRRLSEIGVRKAHGATTSQIVTMLLASFSKPVVIANVAVWPIAFMAARAYLDTFRAPIPLTPLPFLAALAITCAIAWLAVGMQTVRAARARPAEVLRYE